jgi:hypothetical protein
MSTGRSRTALVALILLGAGAILLWRGGASGRTASGASDGTSAESDEEGGRSSRALPTAIRGPVPVPKVSPGEPVPLRPLAARPTPTAAIASGLGLKPAAPNDAAQELLRRFKADELRLLAEVERKTGRAPNAGLLAWVEQRKAGAPVAALRAQVDEVSGGDPLLRALLLRWLDPAMAPKLPTIGGGSKPLLPGPVER